MSVAADVDPQLLAWSKERLLAELDQIFEANPLQAYNHPDLPKRHLKQLAFHAIKVPPLGVKALIAANRSGKTICCVVDDIIQLIPEELVPDHLKPFKRWHPPFHVWVGAPKYSKHEDTIIPMFRKFLPKAVLPDGSFAKAYRSQHRIIELTCGSTIGLKTYDQDLDAWASAEVHRIHWDEEPNTPNSRELRSEARARLISTNGEEIIGMTPLLGFSWVHEDVWERRHEERIGVVQMAMEDNPWASREAIREFAAGLTEEEKQARLRGEFVHFGGLFFPEFRDGLHVVDEVTPDHVRGQDIVIAIDPGLDRTGVAWLSFDSDNDALVFDEHFPTETVVPDVAAEIRERNKAWGIRDPVYVIDPSARNREAINADQIEAAYAREEIYVEHAQNSRAAGILEMKRRLQAKAPDGSPAPSLVFARNCAATIRQVEKYRRDPRSRDEWAAIPQSRTIRFDLVDATRYAVMSRTWEFPEEPAARPAAYQPNIEPPFSVQPFQSDPPPMGAFT